MTTIWEWSAAKGRQKICEMEQEQPCLPAPSQPIGLLTISISVNGQVPFSEIAPYLHPENPTTKAPEVHHHAKRWWQFPVQKFLLPLQILVGLAQVIYFLIQIHKSMNK